MELIADTVGQMWTLMVTKSSESAQRLTGARHSSQVSPHLDQSVVSSVRHVLKPKWDVHLKQLPGGRLTRISKYARVIVHKSFMLMRIILSTLAQCLTVKGFLASVGTKKFPPIDQIDFLRRLSAKLWCRLLCRFSDWIFPKGTQTLSANTFPYISHLFVFVCRF